MHKSNRVVTTIDGPQFINIEENAINPGISKCEVKVFYLGKNRNGSYIDRETAIKMAQSLPGTPIVGAYRKDIEDFGDHGHVVHIEDGEISFSCKTVPYGFVAPNALVWFQRFEEEDEFGNSIMRDYLMTTGYLWTGQYPEVTACITSGKGQSMELDDENLDGHWATDNNSGIEFFIINDAVFSKLCILGDDVEPCFEGASVTSPEVSRNFSVADFSQTLFTMMNELKNALQNKGGSDMPEEQFNAADNEAVEEIAEETPAENENVDAEATEVEETETEETEDVDVEADAEDGDSDESDDDAESEFAAADQEDEEEADSKDEKDADKADDDEKKKQPASDHSLEFAEMEKQLKSLQEELNVLREFKREQEDLKKDALIAKYHMLSDEEKANVIAHKSEYSYEDIEKELALLFVKKNVDFSSVDGHAQEEVEEEESPLKTFSLDSTETAGLVPPMVEALRQVKRN